MAITPEMQAQLEVQRAYFASDELIIERASAWRHRTPEQCWSETLECCRMAERFLAMKTPQELERALAPLPLPEDTAAILDVLRQPK